MASLSLSSLFLAGACLVSSATAAIDNQLVGTWSTKSGKVITGPGFYNPVNDSFIEPSHTGISYSFTADGFYEEAYYRAVSNPTDPSCVQGIMQFQHGTVTMNSDLSLSFEPIKVDGRQLQSDPCTSDNGQYSRYNQTETMTKWQVYIDPYTKMTRLDLYEFDGSKMNPMFLAYSPPVMLPTQTMNPTPSATASATGGSKKRDLGGSDNEQVPIPLNKDSHIHATPAPVPLIHRVDLNVVWWTGVAMIVFGGTAYFL
ncbi:Protein rot1 [Lachnellula willkommii]|uniref:Protein ROT1 n=1 Tax=Lachnellula willkommii TaxID=215461 RepID=A0A559MBL2_9HELO|nr:Protein rot1 [Lachnellula willkommii]